VCRLAVRNPTVQDHIEALEVIEGRLMTDSGEVIETIKTNEYNSRHITMKQNKQTQRESNNTKRYTPLKFACNTRYLHMHVYTHLD
jgi:hypothetical protein